MKVPLLALAAVAAALLGSACEVIEIRQPARTPAVARTAQPVRAWRIVADGEDRGVVVLFRSADSGTFFSVRNAWQQDLGLVDEVGRAWAFRAHAAEPEWVGSGSVAQGAGRILGTEEAPELVEVPLATLGAGEDGR